MKLLDILKEGTLTLTPEERQQIEAMIPTLLDNVKKEIPKNGQIWNLGKINYKFADGEDGEVQIGLGDVKHFTGGAAAGGVFITQDPKNRTDNWIIIDQVTLKPYFPSGFAKFDQDLTRKVIGSSDKGIEIFKQVLRHELIHAKDPALNHYYLKEPYNPGEDKTYFGSWAEFQTFTGQFFEAIIAGADKAIANFSSPEDIKRIEKALSNILQYFAGKTSTISTETKDFIDNTGSRNTFQKIFNFIYQIVGRPELDITKVYISWLSKVKQHNPEGYKEFLKDLYKTIKSIEEKINDVSPTKIKVQEMKSNLNEIKRMQQLAGLLNEVENPEQELKDILKADYPTFVQKLGDNINDPKFREAIKSIANKHPIKTTDISPKVTALKPTQNEIDVDKSLKFPLTNAQSAAVCLKGGAVSIAGKNIVTGGGGKFIIDGHHRWSQLYCMNPEASITAMDVTNITDPMSGLKATQLGIAGDIGKVPVAKVEGQNLLKMGKDALVAYVVKTVTPEVVTVFIKSKKLPPEVTQGLAELANQDKMKQKITKVKYAIAEYIWKNVEQMQQNNQPVSGAPGRGIMPQTDDAANWKDDAANPQAVKEISRMQQLAGIISLNEEEQVANVANKIEDKLESFEDQLQAFAKTVKPSPKDKELNEFEPVTTIATLIAGAPGLLTFLGRGANFIGKAFGGSKDGNVVGKALIKAGHKLEHSYIDGIAAILTGFFPETYANQNQHDESSVLHDHCHAIYAAIVGAAAIVSGIGASHATGVVKALEVGATGLKSSEVIALAQKIAAA